MDQVETAKYRITGLVDIFDEQNNITGQFPIGSVQELPVEVGAKAVEEGRAEVVAEEEVDQEVVADEATGETGEDEVVAEEASGETGESEEDGDNEDEVE